MTFNQGNKLVSGGAAEVTNIQESQPAHGA